MTAGFQVIDVDQLGRPAQIVNTSGPRLPLDNALDHEERMRIMTSLLDAPEAST
jgi:hypothetical protein